MELDRSSYLILAILQKYQAVKQVRGLTVSEIRRKRKNQQTKYDL